MANWRDTFKPARFLGIDARVLYVVLPMMLHIRWYTVVPTVLFASYLIYFERWRNMSIVSSLRLIRSWLIGSLRPPGPRSKIRRPIDYDRRD